MMQSAFYIISYLLLFSAVLFVKKTDEKENAVTFITLSIMTTFCYQALIAGIFSKLGISISIVSVGAIELVTGIIIWGLNKKYGTQRYTVSRADIMGALSAFLVAGFYFAKRMNFGREINFVSIDSASHFRVAKAVAVEHRLYTEMFFAAVNSGLPMEAARPITGDFDMYKVFLLWETGYLFLAGLCFYIIIVQIVKQSGSKPVAVLSMILYMLGYPLYSYIFGFSYFGLCMSLIVYILYAAAYFITGRINRISNYIMINLGLFGLFLCYMMFVPAVYFGVLIAIIAGLIVRHELKLGKLIKQGLGVFLIPSVMGLIFTFMNFKYVTSDVIENGDETGSLGIATDGGCYNDMYSNFVFLLPFIVYGVVLVIARVQELRRENRSEKTGIKAEDSLGITTVSMLFTLIIFMAVLFIGAMHGKVSVYYYVRNNNVLWLFAWIMAAECINALWKQHKGLIISLFAVFSILVIMIGTNIDERILKKNDRFIEVGSGDILNVYQFNHEFNRYPSTIWVKDMELIEYTYTDLRNKETGKLPVLGDPVFCAWVQAITDTDTISVDNTERINTMDMSQYKYIVVQYDGTFIDRSNTIDLDYEIKFENERGFVAEIR